MKRLCLATLALAGLLSLAGAQPAYKAAIFVENRAGPSHPDKRLILEDFLAAGLADAGMGVISRDVAVEALNDYQSGSGDNDSAVDAALRDNTTVVRLAQQLEVDYIFLATISSYAEENRKSSAYGITSEVLVTRYMLTYRVLASTDGQTLIGDSVEVSRSRRSGGSLAVDTTLLGDELLKEGAERMVEAFRTRLREGGRGGFAGLPAPAARGAKVKFTVSCALQDLGFQPVQIPDVIRNADGTYTVAERKIPLSAADAVVELNGVVIGSAPGVFEGTKGLNKLRVTRAGFEPFEANVNLSEGFNLRVNLRFTADGYARFKDNLEFLANLDAKKVLTAAEAERIRGAAEMLKNSYIRVETNDGLTVVNNSLLPAQNSIFFDLFR